jgi:adenine-specific DNA-methyltransferase
MVLDDMTELPSSFADKLGIEYSITVPVDHKKKHGQYFTPIQIANFMASKAAATSNKIKILDPGAGIGILSCALVEYIVRNLTFVKEIEIVAFETDLKILPYTEKCFAYLFEWLRSKGIGFSHLICKNDFILHNSHILNAATNNKESYDIIISNPPYFKLPKKDARAIASQSVIYGQSNIYSIFMILSAKLLSKNGQLIFITPRSFCSGNYFRLFREIFFSLINLRKIHVFDSRKNPFGRDKVLQENIIVVATRKNIQEFSPSMLALPFDDADEIDISHSHGLSDLHCSSTKKFKLQDLLNMNSFQKILHLPITGMDDKVMAIFKNWKNSLASYGFEISTGKVVDFRSTSFINFNKKKTSVPLVWLHNVNKMQIIWPNSYKGKPKGHYILDKAESKSLLIRNTNYVLLRRFSAKDDRNRLIAAAYMPQSTLRTNLLGIENHLNYIYRKKGNLTKIEANGLAALLNSTLFEIYFRTFNGNINVSATELRELPMPDFDLINKLGKEVMKERNELNIDELVTSIFKLEIDFRSN